MSLDTVPTLVLTRDAAGCAAWALRLRDLGARPISFPCLEIRDLERPGVQAELQRALAASSWLCLTSPRGVEALRVRVDALPAALRIAAVGPATAARVRERFGRVDVEAGQLPGTGATARGLAEALLARGEDLGHVVLVTADRGRRELESRLGDRGVSVERFELYRTVPTPPHGPRRDLRQVLAERREPNPDAVTVASPSAFEGLCNQVRVPAELPVITLGPTTSTAVRRAGVEVAAEAERPTVDGLMAAALGLVAKAAAGRARHRPAGSEARRAARPGG